ncbi:MAG: TetR/AcrR family transcriptional regulator [Micrococcales bacterium]|nr:TetR/AcrR family transcriptional regulator [Micrococcales bacterium]
MSSIAEEPVALTLRERKKQQTWDAIHEAALRLVDAQGVDGTTIEQICHEADVSPRTFFNYFPSKPAAALGLPSDVLDDAVIERFRSSEDGLVPALCDLMGHAFSIGRPERKRIKALVARRPELQPAFAQWVGALRTRILEVTETRTGSREDAALAVTLVIAAISAIAHDDIDSDVPTADRLRDYVRRLGEIARR